MNLHKLFVLRLLYGEQPINEKTIKKYIIIIYNMQL